MSERRAIRSLTTSLLSLLVTVGAAFLLPLLFPVDLPAPGKGAVRLLTVLVLTMLVLATQRWRVAIRGTRGDVSISIAIDVATMLLLHPYVAAAGSAVGTGLYNYLHVHGRPESATARLQRGLIRGLVTFSAVALGGWLFRTLRPAGGPILFSADWMAIGTGIAARLAIRVVFYPLGMAALQREPVTEQFRNEWNRLPLVPFLLTTTIGGSAALIWQEQPAAIVLLAGPLAATWAATREFQRLNETLATLEDKVADRTRRLGETVQALERRLAESEALHTVDRVMVQALHPDEVLEAIARESARVTGGSYALVTLLSAQAGRQFVRAAWGTGMREYLGVELPIEGSLTGRVIRTGDPQISLDPPNDPLLNQAMVRTGNWRCVIEAPLRVKDKVLGVLAVATDESVVFDQQDIRLLTLLANQAGLMLENARLHAKAREVAVLEERNRIARELHDSVTQMLFGLSLNLESATEMMARKPERTLTLLGRSQEMAAEALAEMRSLIFELRPAALQEKGLAMALSNHVTLFRRRQGIEVTLYLEGEERLEPHVEFCLYRVAQEALNNVAKHASARQVSVRLSVGEREALLSVHDDGVGFDTGLPAAAPSFGLLGMRERVEDLMGELAVESSLGRGTLVEARIPLRSLQSLQPEGGVR